MKFYSALAVITLMTVVFAAAVVLLVAGKPWLMLISGLAFLGMFIKWGCLAH